MRPTCVVVRCRVEVCVSTAAIAPAMVISMPSSTHAVPRAITILVWKGAQLRRSILAGMRLRTAPAGTAAELALADIGTSCSVRAGGIPINVPGITSKLRELSGSPEMPVEELEDDLHPLPPV